MLCMVPIPAREKPFVSDASNTLITEILWRCYKRNVELMLETGRDSRLQLR